MTPIFRPWFFLEKQTESSYDLFGTVMVPSNSLEVAGLAFEAPAGVNVPDGFFPVQVQLGEATSPSGPVLPGLHLPLDFARPARPECLSAATPE